MITLKYEDEYGGTRVIYECDSTSLQGGYDNAGVLAHMTRFLMAAGYPLERTEELIPFDGDKEYIIDRKDWDELRDKVDELQEKEAHTSCEHYLVWWSEEDGVWIAEHPSYPSFKTHNTTNPAVALSTLRQLEAKERTNADSPTESLRQDGWISWSGGECPVANDKLVSVRLRNGEVYGRSLAGGWNWAHIEDDFDIIAYRVLDESQTVHDGPYVGPDRDTNTDTDMCQEEDV